MLPHLGKISFTKHSDCFVLCQGLRMSGWGMGGRRLGVCGGDWTGQDKTGLSAFRASDLS